MNPSTADILDAVDKVNAKTIFVLPNNKNIILAANQAAELMTDKELFSHSHQDHSSGYHCCDQLCS